MAWTWVMVLQKGWKRDPMKKPLQDQTKMPKTMPTMIMQIKMMSSGSNSPKQVQEELSSQCSTWAEAMIILQQWH
eukprot:9078245-Ditylum_brightwellii.AAC.1